MSNVGVKTVIGKHASCTLNEPISLDAKLKLQDQYRFVREPKQGFDLGEDNSRSTPLFIVIVRYIYIYIYIYIYGIFLVYFWYDAR